MSLLSGALVVFEKQIREMIAKNYGKMDFSRPQYQIKRIGQGDYDVTLSLSGLGVQHISLKIVNDEFFMHGKVAVIGESASFPISIVQDLVNNAVKIWLDRSLDSMATNKDNTITLAPTDAVAKDIVAKDAAAASIASSNGGKLIISTSNNNTTVKK